MLLISNQSKSRRFLKRTYSGLLERKNEYGKKRVFENRNTGDTPKRARYHSGLMDMNILDPGQDFKAHIIYVSSNIQDDSELGRLMHDLNCKNSRDMYSKILAKRVFELKETPRSEVYVS